MKAARPVALIPCGTRDSKSPCTDISDRSRARAERTSRLVGAATHIAWPSSPSRQALPPSRAALNEGSAVTQSPHTTGVTGWNVDEWRQCGQGGHRQHTVKVRLSPDWTRDVELSPAKSNPGALANGHRVRRSNRGHTNRQAGYARGAVTHLPAQPVHDWEGSGTLDVDLGSLLERMAQDASPLQESQEMCVAALDSLTRVVATTKPTAAGVAPLVDVEDCAGCRALLTALTHHCRKALRAHQAPAGGCNGDGDGDGGGNVRSGRGSGLTLRQLLHVSRQLLRLRPRAAQRHPGWDGPGGDVSSDGGGRLGLATVGDGTAGGALSPQSPLAGLLDSLADAAACRLEATGAALVLESGEARDDSPANNTALERAPVAVKPLQGARGAVAGTLITDHKLAAPQPQGRALSGTAPEPSRWRADAAAWPNKEGNGSQGPGAALPLPLPATTAAAAAAAAAVSADKVGAAQAAMLLHNLVKLGLSSGGSTQRLTEALASAAVRVSLVHFLEERPLQDLVWSLGKLDPAIHDLSAVRRLLTDLVARFSEPGLLTGMSPIGLSMVVYGMGKVGMPYTEPGVWQAVLAAVAGAAEAPGCPPQALANMAWGLSRTQPPSPLPPPPPQPQPQPPVPQHGPPTLAAPISVAHAPAGASSAQPASAVLQKQKQTTGAKATPTGSRVSAAPLASPQQRISSHPHQAPPPGPRSVPGSSSDLRGTERGAPQPRAGSPSPSPSPSAPQHQLEAATCLALAEAAERQLDHFKPREAANLLGALASLGALATPRVGPLLAASRRFFSRRVAELGPQDVAEVLYAYAVAPAALAAAPMASAAAAGVGGAAARAPAGIGGGPRDPLKEPARSPFVDQHVLTNSASGTGSWAFSIPGELGWPAGTPRAQAGAWAGATVGAPASKSVDAESELYAALERRCLQLLPRCAPYQVATILWSFAHLGAHRPEGLLAAVADALAARPSPAQEPATATAPQYMEQEKQKRPQSMGQTRQQQQQPHGGAAAEAPARGGQSGGKMQRAGQQSARGRQPGRPQGQEGQAQQPQQHQAQQQQGRQGQGQQQLAPCGLVLDLDCPAALPASHLARLLWALARLGADLAPEALGRVCGVVRRRLHELDTQSLLMAAWSLAALRCPPGATLESLAARLAPLLPSLDPDQLAMALWSVARLMDPSDGNSALSGMASLNLFRASRGPLLTALPGLGPQRLAMAAWAYAAAGVNPGESALAALWRRAAAAVRSPPPQQHMSPQALAMVADAMAEFRCADEELKQAVVAAVAARLLAAARAAASAPRGAHGGGGGAGGGADVRPNSVGGENGQGSSGGGSGSGGGGGGMGVWLSNTVCSLGRLGVHNGRLLDLACHHARLLAPSLSAREAVPLLWGLAAMGRPQGPAAAASGPGTATGAAATAAAAAAAPDACGCPPDVVAALVAVIERAIRADLTAAGVAVPAAALPPPRPPRRQLDGGLLSMFLIACVHHRHRPSAPLLQGACALLLPHLPSLASHTLCEVAWALATLRPPPVGDIGAHVMLPLAAPEAAPSAAPAVPPPQQPQQPQPQPQQRIVGAEAGKGAESDADRSSLWVAIQRAVAQARRRARKPPRRHCGTTSVPAKGLGGSQAATAAATQAAAPAASAPALLALHAGGAGNEGTVEVASDTEPNELVCARAVGPRRDGGGRSGPGPERTRLGSPMGHVWGLRTPTPAAPIAGPVEAVTSAEVEAEAAGTAGTSAAATSLEAHLVLGHRLLRLSWNVPRLALVRLPWLRRRLARAVKRPAGQSLVLHGAAAAAVAEGCEKGRRRTADGADDGMVEVENATGGAAAASAAEFNPGLSGSDGGRRRRRLQESRSGCSVAAAPAATVASDAAATVTEAAARPPRTSAKRTTAAGRPPDDDGSGGIDGAAAAVRRPPPPPLAWQSAPIYPPRSFVPSEYEASQLLLGRLLGTLRRRLCEERSELLTLESLVKVTWAMCVLRMYTPKLFRFCAARALTCSTASLESRPHLLRALIQVRALVARQRPSTWRRLRLRCRWRRRARDGAQWRLSPAELMAAQPPAMVRQVLRCQASLEAAAEAANLQLEWRTTFEGDRHAVLRLGGRTACAVVLLSPWQMAGNEGSPKAGMGTAPAAPAAAAVGRPVAAAVAKPLPAPLAGGALSVRLLRLRGWLVVGLHVERWLALEQRQREAQLAAAHAVMREAARRRSVGSGALGDRVEEGGWVVEGAAPAPVPRGGPAVE